MIRISVEGVVAVQQWLRQAGQAGRTLTGTIAALARNRLATASASGPSRTAAHPRIGGRQSRSKAGSLAAHSGTKAATVSFGRARRVRAFRGGSGRAIGVRAGLRQAQIAFRHPLTPRDAEVHARPRARSEHPVLQTALAGLAPGGRAVVDKTIAGR